MVAGFFLVAGAGASVSDFDVTVFDDVADANAGGAAASSAGFFW